jgi:PAS domain S-box-containing protein
MSPNPTVPILLVDDSPENLLALEAILGNLGQTLVKASSGREALRYLLRQDFALILLDVQMPGMDEFETASLIRRRSRSRSTPIIFLTAFDTDKFQIFQGYSLGAVDYLIKPLDPDILLSKVSVFVELHQQKLAIQHQATQLAELNARLTTSEERFRLLCNCSPIGIFLTDTAGYLTYMNPYCQELWHLSLQPGNSPTDWLHQIHPEDQNWFSTQWIAAIRASQPFAGEFRLLLEQNHEAWVYLRTAPLISEHRALLGYVGTLEDVTDRKQAEANRLQFLQEQIARQEAEAANRRKDKFLMTLSHELRTPLNPILGWSQILQRQADSSDNELLKGLKTIERNAKLQQHLIEDILDVSNIIQGKLHLNLRPIALISVVEQALETVRAMAEAKAIDLHLTIAKTNLKTQVEGDPARLQQVIWNLLTNAIKFTPRGGQVEVQIDTVEDVAPPERSIPTFVQVSITDTGIGISPTLLPRIFDRFYQADSSITRQQGGLGLGLAIAHHLVELHQGVLQAASAGKNQGATFTVRLPRLLEQQEGDQQELLDDGVSDVAPASIPTVLDDLRVLIVDDQPDSLEMLRFTLQGFGAVVTTAQSVDEALAAFQQQQPDLLISDIGLPEKDGYALINQIRASDAAYGANIPAIALTGYASSLDQRQALSSGFQRHLAKPIDPALLVEVATSLIEEYQRQQVVQIPSTMVSQSDSSDD